jgi:hypothetical protein
MLSAVSVRFHRTSGTDRSLAFAELKARSFINPRAKRADASPNFSELIRIGLPSLPKSGVAR